MTHVAFISHSDCGRHDTGWHHPEHVGRLRAIPRALRYEPELFEAMDDLRASGVQVLTLGQYLRPSPQHLPVVEYIRPEVFEQHKELAYSKGFEHVASGPLVRSSYHSADYKPRELGRGVH